jgi:hypothetical protein
MEERLSEAGELIVTHLLARIAAVAEFKIVLVQDVSTR